MKLFFSILCLCLTFELAAKPKRTKPTAPKSTSSKPSITKPIAESDPQADLHIEHTACFTVALHQGNRSIFGAEFETGSIKQFSLQLNAELYGGGASINYHLSKILKNSFLNYFDNSYVGVFYARQGTSKPHNKQDDFNVGFVDSHTQTLVGPKLVLRSPKYLMAEVGVGYILGTGVRYIGPPDQKYMVQFSVGVYFPLGNN